LTIEIIIDWITGSLIFISVVRKLTVLIEGRYIKTTQVGLSGFIGLKKINAGWQKYDTIRKFI
jgi:hypothetical protein